MQQKCKRSLAVFGICGAIVFTAVFRTLILFLVDQWTEQMRWNYGWIGLLLVAFFAVLFLDRKGAERMIVPKKRNTLFAAIHVFVGFVLLFSCLMDAFLYFFKQTIPSPSAQLMGQVDTFVLLFQFLFGIFSGIYFVCMGMDILHARQCNSYAFRAASLLPVLWAAMFLVRYELSYVSAIDIGQSFYDFALLVCTTVFLFMLAKYNGLRLPHRPKGMVAVSAATAVLSLSAALLRSILFFTDIEVTAYQAGYILTLPLFAVGILAAAVTMMLLCGQKQEQSTEQVEEISE